MTLKKTLSFLLALTLVLSILAPCAVLKSGAVTTLYGEAELEQVTAPEIGESYYLAASTGEEMIYFRHGSVTETAPYSLATSRSMNHNWVVKVTLEDSTLTQEQEAGYFQLTYTNPSNGNTSRIYCYDAAGKDSIMDTGANSANYKNRHSFIIDDIDGLKVLRKVGNNNILVAKQMEYTRNVTDAEGNTSVQTGTEWRILGVPEADLGNDGVHPVMLLTEHTHTYDEVTVDAASNTASRSCSCGKAITVYDQKVTAVDEPQIGGSYHLTANVDGTIRYFIHGTVTETSPASLRTSDNLDHNWAFPVSIEAPVEGDVGFQMTYTNPSSATVRIYCYDSIGNDGIADTGVNSKSTLATHTFFVDEVGGVKLLRQIDNNSVLVVKELEFSRNVTDAEGNTSVQTGTEWRILGVDESELANEGVYPVFLSEKHTHTAYGTTYQISDSGHSPICWCGGYAAPVAHTYGEVTADADNNTHSHSCSVCGYTNVIYSQKYEQVTTPTIGGTYYLAANVEGQLLSCNVAGGGYTGTSPYSLKTTTTIAAFTLNKALKAGQGEFQLVDENGKYLYSVAAGAGATVSSGYINDPAKVSFSMDTVNGQSVIRAYGTQNVLVVKYSDAQSAWRMWCLPESELANEGVYPVVMMDTHEHTADGEWSFDTENSTQSRNCTVCGAVAETLYGTDNKVSMAADPQVGDSYYLAANVDGKIYYFRHGAATDTVPYSLVVTSEFTHNWVKKVTLEDYTATSDGATEGFQLTYTNPTNEALTRIYCYDVLKDATVAGQTGIMDTGINTVCYKNRHTFVLAQIDGQTVIQKTSNNNVLVVKMVPQTVDGKTTNVLRMLGVPASELANEGVYPVMLANAHTHNFKVYNDENSHWSICDCGSRTPVASHNYASWTLDADAMTQSADCSVCGHSLTVDSPYFDTVDSEEELQHGLAENVYDEETALYSVAGGNSYYLIAEKDGERYYFRQTVKTAAGNTESVTTTDAYSLYITNDPNHRAISLVNVSAGYSDNTYILSFTTDKTRALYVNDEGKDGNVDTGITTFNGALNSPTYISRAECMWDAENGVLYHIENGEKYILVMKELSATYKFTDPDTNETTVVEGPVNEWRIAAVPAEDATAENGCYILKLAQHIHNYPAQYNSDEANHWKNCPCGREAENAPHAVEQWTVIAPPTETETGSKTGVCTVCGATVTVETPVTVNSWNIVLGDNIGVNFVLALTEGDTVTVTVDGEEVPVTLTDKGNGTYTVFIELAAAQMADEIVISVNGYAIEKTYSVRAYADIIRAGDYTSHTKALVENMLVYGGAAQRYFGHNTSHYADDGIEITAVEPGEAPELVVLNELSGVSYYGASLLHREKTAVRFYFTADSVEGLTFQVDGNIYEPASKNGLYYIEVSGINPQDLDDTLNVVVTDGENSLAVQYSPLIYIARMYAKATDGTKAVVQAMYNYHLAAKAYLANLNLSDDFAVQSQSESVLYEGVTLYEKTYVAAGYGEVKAHIIAVNADANVELKVSAGAWDETNNADNPAEAMTVVKHFRTVKNAGYNVLGMINGGFFDLNNTQSYLPYGMQVVDGVVKQAPSTANNYSNNWFGMTKDGKYVISNAAGYESTYAGNVQQAVGGGKLLIVDGIPVNLTSERAYRTAVGVNANGDLVMVAVEDATYSDVCHIFVDMGLDILTVLNLDGGGSTAMYVPGTYYPKALILGEDGLLPREVADAVAIVVKQ